MNRLRVPAFVAALALVGVFQPAPSLPAGDLDFIEDAWEDLLRLFGFFDDGDGTSVPRGITREEPPVIIDFGDPDTDGGDGSIETLPPDLTGDPFGDRDDGGDSFDDIFEPEDGGGGGYVDQPPPGGGGPQPNPIPEPLTILLFGTGAASCWVARQRRSAQGNS